MERMFNNDKWEKIKINGQSHAAQITKINDEEFLFLLMEELLLRCPENCHVEHLNGYTLDNRKENLRIKTGLLSIDSVSIEDMKNRKSESVTRCKDDDDAGHCFYSVNTVLVQ